MLMNVIACVIALDVQLFQVTRHSLLGNTPHLMLQKLLPNCKAGIKQHKRMQSDSGVLTFCILIE